MCSFPWYFYAEVTISTVIAIGDSAYRCVCVCVWLGGAGEAFVDGISVKMGLETREPSLELDRADSLVSNPLASTTIWAV